MKTAAQSGFSLIEVMVVTVILTIVIGGIFEILHSGLTTYNEGSIMTEVQTHARRIMDAVAGEIQGAGVSTLYPVPPATGTGTDTIDFQIASGYSGGSVLWSDVITIAFEYETGESNDCVDNNGNGLIDEGVVTRTVTPAAGTPQTRILGHWVKEGGLAFNLNGDLLTITLTLEKPGYRDEPWKTTLVTAVKLKND
jgi:prepilin-type N-terminal cleavage/methylation domain-containing protein